MAVDKSLLTGSTTMLILKLLDETNMYGYQMIDELRIKLNNCDNPWLTTKTYAKGHAYKLGFSEESLP